MKRLTDVVKGFYFNCDPYTGCDRFILSVFGVIFFYIALIAWLEG